MQKNRFLLFLLVALSPWVQGHAQALVCNDLTFFSLDENCKMTITDDQILEGICQCPLGTLVELDKTVPFGNGPWVAPELTKADIGQSYQVRVTSIASGNKCWGTIKVEDKIPPKLICSGLTTVNLGANGTVNLSSDALQVTVTDACSDPGQITLKLDNNATSVNYTCANLGPNTLGVTATDVYGNTASCQTTVLVTDSLSSCVSGCVTSCPPAQIVTFEQGFFVLLPDWKANNLASFEFYGTAGFDPTCQPSDTNYTITYRPAATGFASFLRRWDIALGGVPFGHCEQSILFPTTRTFTISGKVFVDTTQNCQPDANEAGIQIFPVTVTKLPGNRQFSTLPNADGTYALEVEMNTTDSLLVVRLDLPASLVTPCPSVLYIPDTTSQLQQTMNFGVYLGAQCPLPNVSIGTDRLRRCSSSNFYIVRYSNLGYAVLPNAYITVELDNLLSIISADRPYTSMGNLHTFQLGNVPALTNGVFMLRVNVDCNAVLGQTLCSEAILYPNDPCKPSWNGPRVKTGASCEGDSVRLVVRNWGNQDMSETLEYIVVEDIIMRGEGSFNLAKGDSIVIKVPANGATWRIEAEQVAGYGHDRPAAAVEFCGGLNTPGLINAFALNDDASYKDIDCNEVIGSFDPNDKTAVPTGYTSAHIIRANTDLEYKIRFQNTGTDTAFRVVIVDTLSRLLDPASFEAGVSSHPYRLDVRELGILNFVFPNIMLPDSNTNEPASHGFLTFRMAQKPDLSNGTVIENNAAIYFDFNDPVITNTAFHTIGAPNISVATHKPYLPDVRVSVRPNPFWDRAVLDVRGRALRQGLLRLYDAMGRPVQTQIFTGNQCNMERGNLPAGTYFFQIMDEGTPVGSGTMQVR